MRETLAATLRIGFVVSLLVLVSSLAWGGTVDCSTVNTVGDLIGLGSGGCIQQDKIYYNVTVTPSWDPSHPIPTDATVVFNLTTLPGMDVHDFTINFANLLTAGTYVIDYWIKIDPSSPNYYNYMITNVLVSENLSDRNGGTTDTKVVLDSSGNVLLTLVATKADGQSANGDVFQNMLHIEETIVVKGGDTLHSITDEFTETFIPEPGTMAFVGAGLLGLGALLRRRVSKK